MKTKVKMKGSRLWHLQSIPRAFRMECEQWGKIEGVTIK